jgi:hypothetical protein
MLAIDLSVIDVHGKNLIVAVKVVRGKPHTKLRNAFYYRYSVVLDDKIYTGTVVHSYDNGAVALTAKVTRAIVLQQKAERAKK